MAKIQHNRFALLPYQILARRWLVPSMMLIPGGYLVKLSAEQNVSMNSASADLGWVISIIGVLLTLYLYAALSSHVAFLEDRFVLRTPFYPLVISYQSIKLVHPIELRLLFPRKGMKPGLYHLYRKLWNRTVPVVLLEDLPLPRWWLKLWIHPLLVHPDTDGIILVVREWMACSRLVDTMRIDASRTPWMNLK